MIAVLVVSHFGDICYERIAGVQFILRVLWTTDRTKP